MLKLCGDTEEKLAQELLLFELQIERDVVEPLYMLAEVSESYPVRPLAAPLLFLVPYRSNIFTLPPHCPPHYFA